MHGDTTDQIFHHADFLAQKSRLLELAWPISNSRIDFFLKCQQCHRLVVNRTYFIKKNKFFVVNCLIF